MDGLLAMADRIEDDSARRHRSATSHPADPMVIVHTSGSTSEPKGVVHTHGPLIRHLDNLNQIRGYTPRRDPVRQLAVVLDRRLRVRVARHPGRRRPPRVLERGRRGGRPRRPRAGAADDGERLRPVGRAPAPRPVVRSSGPVLDPEGEPLSDHARRRPSEGSRPPALDARDDRDGQRVPALARRERSFPSTSAARSVGLRPASRPGSSIPIRGSPVRSARPESCGCGARSSWRATTAASGARSSSPTGGSGRAISSTSTTAGSSTSTAGAAT